MKKALPILRRIARDEGGATMLEYAFVGGLISIVIVLAATGIGGHVSDFFSSVADGFRGKAK